MQKVLQLSDISYKDLMSLTGTNRPRLQVSIRALTRRIPNSILAILIDFSLTVKAATLILIFGRSSAISSAKEGKSGFIYNLVKS